MRMPLVDGNGNFGSPGNDPAAAMRYTECRLAPLAMEMLREIDEDTVDFSDNYDGRQQEPDVLPARFPNRLVNGSAGIAVGMATNIPPHNLREIAEGVQWYLANHTASKEELLAALLTFRVAYFVIPFLLATVALGLRELALLARARTPLPPPR